MAAATQSAGHMADVVLGLASGPAWGLTEQGFETAELVFYFVHPGRPVGFHHGLPSGYVNIAMENGEFIVDSPIRTAVYKGFSAM